MKDNDNIKTTIEKYFHELVVINSTFEIFLSMKHDEKWRRIADISSTYFSLVRKSLNYDFIVCLSRLFEKESRSDYNIYKFNNVLRKHYSDNLIVLNSIDEFENYLNNLTLIDNLLKWRDKAIAHLDKEGFEDISIIGKKYPLNIDEIRVLISRTFKFLNDIYYDFDHVIQTQLYNEYDDYKKLIHIVDQYK